MTQMYHHEATLIRNGKCPRNCREGRTVNGVCLHCGGTGKPRNPDLERLALYDKGLCLICGLPRADECAGAKYDHTGANDCLDHLRQHTAALEKRLEMLENGKDAFWRCRSCGKDTRCGVLLCFPCYGAKAELFEQDAKLALRWKTAARFGMDETRSWPSCEDFTKNGHECPCCVTIQREET